MTPLEYLHQYARTPTEAARDLHLGRDVIMRHVWGAAATHEIRITAWQMTISDPEPVLWVASPQAQKAEPDAVDKPNGSQVALPLSSRSSP